MKTDRVTVLKYLTDRGHSMSQARKYLNRVLGDPRDLARCAANVRAGK